MTTSLKLIAVAALPLLAACGGGSGSSPAAEEYADLSAEALELQGEFRSGTALTLPNSGGGRFEGVTVISVPGSVTGASNGNQRLSMVGETVLDVDFLNDRWSGEATNFHSIWGDRATEAQRWTGRIDYDMGKMGVGEDDNDMIAVTQGALRNGTNVLEVDGDLRASLRASTDPRSNDHAIYGNITTDSDLWWNGVNVIGNKGTGFEVIAED